MWLKRKSIVRETCFIDNGHGLHRFIYKYAYGCWYQVGGNIIHDNYYQLLTDKQQSINQQQQKQLQNSTSSDDKTVKLSTAEDILMWLDILYSRHKLSDKCEYWF